MTRNRISKTLASTVLSLSTLLLIHPVAFAQTCKTTPALTDPAAGAHWNGWGATVANTRFQSADQAKLNAVDVPKLKLKWAFGIENVMQARSQPAIAGGRLIARDLTKMICIDVAGR